MDIVFIAEIILLYMNNVLWKLHEDAHCIKEIILNNISCIKEIII